MQDHYFINNDELEDNFEKFDYFFKNSKVNITTNSGIFSPGRVDMATDLLLRNLPQISGDFLDLGCGCGVIGISVAKAYGVNLTMSDVNERALNVAKINAQNNSIKAEIILSDAFENIDKNFDNVTLNPPIHAGKDTVFKLYEGAFQHLKDGGKFFVVIQKKHGAESSIKKLTEIFNNCTTLYKKKGYYILMSQK